jgi:hypothetical protein
MNPELKALMANVRKLVDRVFGGPAGYSDGYLSVPCHPKLIEDFEAIAKLVGPLTNIIESYEADLLEERRQRDAAVNEALQQYRGVSLCVGSASRAVPPTAPYATDTAAHMAQASLRVPGIVEVGLVATDVSVRLLDPTNAEIRIGRLTTLRRLYEAFCEKYGHVEAPQPLTCVIGNEPACEIKQFILTSVDVATVATSVGGVFSIAENVTAYIDINSARVLIERCRNHIAKSQESPHDRRQDL